MPDKVTETPDALSSSTTPRLPDGTLPRQWWPLPENYGDLDEAAQRFARLQAVSLHSSADEFVAAWTLFRQLYFVPLPEGSFYHTGFLSSPPAHYEWIRDFARYPRNIFAAPRGSSKSTVMGKELPLLLALTQPYHTILLVLANDRMVEERIDEIMEQLEHNEWILSDFGTMKPARGEKIWNRHQLSLLNGSVIRGLSIGSRKRGQRPNTLILDDPEFDPEREGSETEMMQELETLVFRGLLPMMEESSSFVWIGTMLTRRSALWMSCMGEDPRFNLWNRRVYNMIQEQESGRTSYFWEEKWDARRVDTLRRLLGTSGFESECQNNPIASSDRILRIHPQFNTYRIAGGKVLWQTPSLILGPTGTTAGVEETHDRPLPDFLNNLAVMFTVDSARTVSPTSDFSSILVTGIDIDRVWWVLDLFLGRLTMPQLFEEVSRLGLLWRPDLVAVEDVDFQDYLRQQMELHIAATQPQPHSGFSGSLAASLAGSLPDTLLWKPHVFPVKYPHKLSKAARAAALSPRLSRYQLRLPDHLRQDRYMRHLFRQIEDFTMDLALLPHDDALDTLAMVGYCPRISPGETRYHPDQFDPLAQLLAGRTTEIQTGLPLSVFVDLRTVDPSLVDTLRYRRYQHAERDKHTLRNRSPQEKLSRMGSRLTTPVGIMRGREALRSPALDILAARPRTERNR